MDEIPILTLKNDESHCPWKWNPVDLLSRGKSTEDLTKQQWNVPEFLYQPETKWPGSEPTSFGDKEAIEEDAKNTINITHFLVNSTVNEPTTPKVDNLIDIKWFRKLMNLLCMTNLVIKFVNKQKNMVWTKSHSGSGTAFLIDLELTNAEELWIKAVPAS